MLCLTLTSSDLDGSRSPQRFTAENLPVSLRSTHSSFTSSKSSQTSLADVGGRLSPEFSREEENCPCKGPFTAGTALGATESTLHSQRTQSDSTLPDILCEKTENLAAGESAVDIDGPLFLERAAPRRLDWTPPQETKCIDIITEENKSAFGDILGSFTYEGKQNARAFVEIPDLDMASRKKRKLDLVGQDLKTSASDSVSAQIAVPAAKISKGKSRSPKKKPTTITGRATSQFLGEEEQEPAPLMQYLTPAENDDTSTSKASRAKPKKLSKPRHVTKKKPEIIVLSPESALKQYDGQDLLFGTASQVACEESPTILRQTIQALKESESFMLSHAPSLDGSITTSMTSRTSINSGSSKNLWAAASRGEEDSLLDIDSLDVSRSPHCDFAAKTVSGPIGVGDCFSAAIGRPGGEDRLDVDAASSKAKVQPSLGLSSRRPTLTTSKIAGPCDSLTSVLPARTIHTKTVLEGPANELAAASTTSSKGPTKPMFTGMSSNELATKLKSYGFKPVKKRDKMIELLERCWEDQHQEAKSCEEEPYSQQGTSHEDILSGVFATSARPAPKVSKARGRRKQEDNPSPEKGSSRAKKSKTATTNATGTTEDVPEQQEMSTSTSQAKKPRSKSTSTSTKKTSTTSTAPLIPPEPPNKPTDSPQSLTPLLPLQEATPPPLPSLILPALLSYQPPSSPRHNHILSPTFYEKILMYDPIVIEDLTEWLNTKGFRGINEDREISTVEVRDWCEGNGVTCIWKGGWRRGKEKAMGRDDDD
ncbi:putative structure-specific endonuclease subunit slx4 [Phaeomoniella chlamydospora]|uniref:Structure-specific endonuclease subunit SLX4 n=1 Tax=Phaeomoniella chlamydospora TaxID=158046 RepID=A0A0G2H757_PHACM|nr:putative structure-specific endonuclease subunit slx4 [Phaeomoniella chlamydospora]